jgi:hypothetical protein
MTLKFVAHDTEYRLSKANPFDEAIKDILQEHGDCYIVTPFFSIEVIKDICSTCEKVIMVTDIRQIKTNIVSNNSIKELQNMVISNNLVIYDIMNLHAKVLLRGNKLLIGSANFTNNGLGLNQEADIFISQEDLILNVHQWIINIISSATLMLPEIIDKSFLLLPSIDRKYDNALNEVFKRGSIHVKETQFGKQRHKDNEFYDPEKLKPIKEVILATFNSLEDAIKAFHYFKLAYDVFQLNCHNKDILSITYTKDNKLTINIGQWEIISIRKNKNYYVVVLAINEDMFKKFDDLDVIRKVPFSVRWQDDSQRYIWLRMKWFVDKEFPIDLISAWNNTILHACSTFDPWISSTYKRFHRDDLERVLSMRNDEIKDIIESTFNE